ncbi:MAG: hypothetical protein AUG51_18365 [Acidobacteria bacterium 13_1_20CM_3_53_8]|nr:MAG: hypothetical protein AUG51_18365 [Acidobacteria bacterium 13_1_20CM_3_53_8]
MIVTEQIADRLQKLPPSLQREVLDFIEFLAQKVAQREAASEEAEWMKFSLAQAMEGMENEDSPEYSEADVKERWQ